MSTTTYISRPDLDGLDAKFKSRHPLFTQESPLVEGVRDMVRLIEQMPELIAYARHLETVIGRFARFGVMTENSTSGPIDGHHRNGRG